MHRFCVQPPWFVKKGVMLRAHFPILRDFYRQKTAIMYSQKYYIYYYHNEVNEYCNTSMKQDNHSAYKFWSQHLKKPAKSVKNASSFSVGPSTVIFFKATVNIPSLPFINLILHIIAAYSLMNIQK